MNRDELVEAMIEGLYHSFGGDIARHNFAPGAELAISLVVAECARIAEEKSPAKHYRMDELTEYGQARAGMASDIAEEIRTRLTQNPAQGARES